MQATSQQASVECVPSTAQTAKKTQQFAPRVPRDMPRYWTTKDRRQDDVQDAQVSAQRARPTLPAASATAGMDRRLAKMVKTQANVPHVQKTVIVAKITQRFVHDALKAMVSLLMKMIIQQESVICAQKTAKAVTKTRRFAQVAKKATDS